MTMLSLGRYCLNCACASAVLARWLVLYMLGDPETAEAELASELAGIYRDAFPSTKGALSLLQKDCCSGGSTCQYSCLAERMRGRAVERLSEMNMNVLCCHAGRQGQDAFSSSAVSIA